MAPLFSLWPETFQRRVSRCCPTLATGVSPFPSCSRDKRLRRSPRTTDVVEASAWSLRMIVRNCTEPWTSLYYHRLEKVSRWLRWKRWPLGYPWALAWAIEEMLSDGESLEFLGNAARDAMVVGFSWQGVVHEYLELLNPERRRKDGFNG